VPEPVPDATSPLSEAERLTQGGGLASTVDVLARVVEVGGSLPEVLKLAALYLELGEHDKALHYASLAVERDPSLAPARDVLAKVNVALKDYASALSDFQAVAALTHEQRAAPPDQYAIPAHFALHNLEQLDHILSSNRGQQASAGDLTEKFNDFRGQLVDLIDGADGEPPWVPLQGEASQIVAIPPYLKVSEERLPRYVNTSVDYRPIQQAIVTGQKVQVIDDFLTPEGLGQLRKFCLESTVWRHPYKFGYVGAFPQNGFASTSLFAIAEEFSAALGEAFDGYQLAQWWAFVYDTKLPGTDIHGDDADFSLNLWITPDSANLDPDGGGLVIWDKTAPSDWSYNDYNSGGDRVRQYLRDQNAASRVIPYRENRAVLFEGHLFHRTDDFSFAPGFENRRRSVTFLFRRSKS
jgi:tetratricopeptide (TPR) repeat protein